MILIRYNGVERHFKNNEYFSIYLCIANLLQPEGNLSNVDPDLHLSAAEVESWCEFAEPGDTYEGLKEQGIEIICY